MSLTILQLRASSSNISSSTIKWPKAANFRLQSRHKLHEPLAINYSNRNLSIGTVLILQAIEFILLNDLSHCIIPLAQMLDTVNQKSIQAGNYRIIGLKLCENNPLENNTSVITRPREGGSTLEGTLEPYSFTQTSDKDVRRYHNTLPGCMLDQVCWIKRALMAVFLQHIRHMLRIWSIRII